mgnify:CR=1 FL=1
MEAIPVSWYLMLSAFMFAMGVTGVVIRRNPIVIFMCIELMLNAANLAFLAFARQQAQLGAQVAGQVYTILVMAVAAAGSRENGRRSNRAPVRSCRFRSRASAGTRRSRRPP